MRLSNFADYAIVTMSAAARHCGSARVSSAALAAETGLPVPTVQKLVSKLTAAGLLRSIRGAGGGLQLARPAAAITMADIVEAVEGPIAFAPSDNRPHAVIISYALRNALADVPLTGIAQQMPMPAPVLELAR